VVLPRLSGPLGLGSVFIALPFPDSKGSFYLITGMFQFSPHVGRGLSTVTTRLEWCASLGLMGNPSGTRYHPQSTWSSAGRHRETSHKTSVVNPIGPQSPPSRLEGKIPPPEGVNPGGFEANDSNIGRDGRVAPHHRLEP